MKLDEILKNAQISQFIDENGLTEKQQLLEDNLDVLNDYISQKRQPLFPDYDPKLLLIDDKIDIFYEKSTDALPENLLRIGQSKSLSNVSFADFQVDEQRNEAFIAAISFVEHYTLDQKFRKGIYLWGNFGVGKSYLMSAMLNELAAKHVETAFVTISALINRLNESQMLEKQRLIRKIAHSRVLVFDDLGAGDLTTWLRDNVIAAILDDRMNYQRPTFFTSNFDIKSLQDQYLAVARGVAEPIKAARIAERIKFLSNEIKMGGESHR
ncbi:AFG1/ZapE family ATPase [Oenococcus sicerae]|uniref:Cell division protein ZapE n=1 Tax=Oenococcus sicerae TaxID=2203724 RepID=A0AAJ1R801_9LACO|nr:AFG1/ZapE family ATPase [Oenococcus sicerae]MDN6899417.1 cell division protein ZapE [Oenococcus sicerae]